MNPEQALRLARQLALVADTADMRDQLMVIMRDHRPSVTPRYGKTARCMSDDHGFPPPHAPCTTLQLAACQLRVVELLDGTRFSGSWPGPVDQRSPFRT